MSAPLNLLHEWVRDYYPESDPADLQVKLPPGSQWTISRANRFYVELKFTDEHNERRTVLLRAKFKK